MRSLIAALVAVFIMVLPSAASAYWLGEATTTTGETLQVTIDFPEDGIAYGPLPPQFSGVAGLYGGSGQHTSVERVAVGYGDGYGVPGSTDLGDADFSRNPLWYGNGLLTRLGTQTVYATAITADGTRATATQTFTRDPKWRTVMLSHGVVSDPNFRNQPPALRASLTYGGQYGWQQRPLAGQLVSFYVKTERVCDAITDSDGLATCSSPVAVAKALAANDGYTSVFRESDTYHGSSDWGAYNYG